jgi:hypothetical protein
MKNLLLLSIASFAALTTACTASSGENATSGDEAITSAAKLTLSADHKENLDGTAKVGAPIEIDYALERLPQCRGNIGGGGPGWTITGYYSENGGAAKTFDVSKVTADGLDREAMPAFITPTQAGDLSLWFQVTSVFGCENYDSAFGQNFHVQVGGGVAPEALPTITFDKTGAPSLSGDLKAGGKALVHYEQDRLSVCEQVQGGIPQYGIGGHAQINGGAVITFDTGRAEDGKRVTVDAVVNLTAAGDLALWFETSSVSGCHQYDSNSSANYHFTIK